MSEFALLLPNPFLDINLDISTPNLVQVGQPLDRVMIPPITTQIYKASEAPTSLAMVTVQHALDQSSPGPTVAAASPIENIGITLDNNLLMMGSQTPGQPQVSGQLVGRQIPTNMREARDALALITPQRTGKKNEVYGIGELRQVARNLNIPTSGKKAELANRIRSQIIEYFNLQMQ